MDSTHLFLDLGSCPHWKFTPVISKSYFHAWVFQELKLTSILSLVAQQALGYSNKKTEAM